MFESARKPVFTMATSGRQGPLSTHTLRSWTVGLAGIHRAVSDAERIEQLQALEELKAAAAAAQAKITGDFVASQREEQRASGVRARDVGKGICAQVALARRESPHRGNMLVGLAEALVHEMPHTLAALEGGVISEHRARILVKETACLSREDRTHVDMAVAADPVRLATLGNRRLEAEAKKAAYRIDSHSVTARAANAERDRRVSIRPAPDTMVWLTALLPVAAGVGCYAALRKAADAARAAGDDRAQGQAMADILVERLTGRATADATPVVVNLLMTDHSLLNGDAEPAHVDGYGPLPVGVARQLLGEAEKSWLRRIYTKPGSGQLISMESRARLFPKALAKFIALRDQTCRTPWCDAPIRHSDHIAGHGQGGHTSRDNGQGLCEACNQAKRAPGWRSCTERATSRAGPHTVRITTPTGQVYTSQSPDPPGVVRRVSGPRVDWVVTELEFRQAA